MNYCENYKQLYSTTFRSVARSAAISVLKTYEQLKYGFAPKPCVQFAYFHHMFQDEVKNARKLLEKLADHYTFISYSEAIRRVQNNEIDKPYLCFSSDDGIKNNLIAAAIFRDFGIKCCFFINPSIIGCTDYEQVKTFCKQRLNMPPVEFLTWKEVEQLLADGHEIGDHSWEHHNLAQLSKQELIDDLSKSKTFLEKKIGTLKHFAYPYGAFQYFSEEAFSVANSLGYDSCASAVRGCHKKNAVATNWQQKCIKRDVIVFNDAVSDSLFFLRRAYLN